MHFSEFQKAARKTAIYPDRHGTIGLMYAALGLNGEAGEVAEQVKKIVRSQDPVEFDSRRESALKELGDVLWYAAALCDEFNTEMGIVAAEVIERLNNRAREGTLHGDGSER